MTQAADRDKGNQGKQNGGIRWQRSARLGAEGMQIRQFDSLGWRAK
jgi:hypothetical protein